MDLLKNRKKIMSTLLFLGILLSNDESINKLTNARVFFKLENIGLGMLVDFDTRNYKKKLHIGNNVSQKDIRTIT